MRSADGLDVCLIVERGGGIALTDSLPELDELPGLWFCSAVWVASAMVRAAEVRADQVKESRR
jgi:hypothetical protein